MAQLTLYVEEKLLRQIEQEAKKEKSSVSRWVSRKIAMVLQRSWPASFRETAGALKFSGLKRPDQGNFAQDTRKGRL